MSSLSLSSLTLKKQVSKLDSSLNIYEDTNGSHYCLKNLENSLASDRFSFLTTLKHPCLLKYYHLTDQQNGEIAEEYCPFGSLSDLIQAQHKFSANDLWCILTQLVYLSEFIVKRGLLIKDYTPANVFVLSLNPIRIKVSLIFSPSQRFSFHVGQKLLVSESDCTRSELDKSLVTTIMTTMKFLIERIRSHSFSAVHFSDHDRVLRELIFFKIVKLDDFKRITCISSFVVNSYSTLLLPKPIQISSKLVFSKTLLFNVFTQSMFHFDQPLLKFDLLMNTITCRNKNFSKFASKIINVSSLFRDLFISCFDFLCAEGGHVLKESSCNMHVSFDVLSQRVSLVKTSYIATIEHYEATPLCLNFFNKFPCTCIYSISSTFLPSSQLCFSRVIRLELYEFDQLFSSSSLLSHFPCLSELCLFEVKSVHFGKLNSLSTCHCLRSLELFCFDFLVFIPSEISSLVRLTSLSLHRFMINDLAPLSSLENLSSLSLKGSKIYDLLPLQHLPNLSYLDLRKTTLSREFRRIVRGRSEVKKVVNSFPDIIHLDLSSYNIDVFIDLSFFVKHSNLKSLNLANTIVSKSDLSVFTKLERLDFSDCKGFNSILTCCNQLKALALDGLYFSDLDQLSSLIVLESLSLRRTQVFDLWPLRDLPILTYLDIRETNLPTLHQELLTETEQIKHLIELYIPQVTFMHRRSGTTFDISLITDFKIVKLLSLDVSNIAGISHISKLINLEFLELSRVMIFEDGICHTLDNISFISSLVFLKSLSLDYSDVVYLTPLSLLTQLERLSMLSTPVFDLSPLSSLTKLALLDVRNTKLPRECQILATNVNEVQHLITCSSMFILSTKESSINVSGWVVGKRRSNML
ncbi:hypothetical protein RCL1_007714 [Eukaryota sp. TZLM3-RCL]